MNFAVLIIIINFLFFAAGAYYYVNMKRELQKEREQALEGQKLHLEEVKKDDNKLDEELTEVKRKATMILLESEKIARDLIVELELNLGKANKKMGSMIPPGFDFEEELREVSEKIKEQYTKRIHSMLGALEKYELREAHKIEEFAEQEQITTDQNLQKMRVEELQKMHDKIEDYKREEIALFDKKVQSVIDAAAVEVLGKALTSNEQAELIFKALEKIKHDNTI